MTISYSGSDKNIQRKARRAYQYLKENSDTFKTSVPEQELHLIIKAICIAIDEDLVNNTYWQDPEQELAPDRKLVIDEETASTLEPIPYDPDF